MNCIEIFSGAGGLAKGLELAGANHKAFVEINGNACKTLRKNFDPHIVFENDVRSFDFSYYQNIDIIAGGPPCQPFSLGGKAKGMNDERDMFPSAISSIRILHPKVFIFENVKGLLRQSFADYFEYIIRQLQNPNIILNGKNWRENLYTLKQLNIKYPTYRVTYMLVNAADYGIPQIRERVIIIGIRNDLHINWEFPKPTHSRDALLWDMFVTKDYWTRHGISNHYSNDITSSINKRLKEKYSLFSPTLKPWVTVRDAINTLGEPYGDGEHRLRTGAKEYPGHTGSNIDEPSKTIKAGSHGIPGGENMIRFSDGHLRYYTVAEAKRIQTFPDDYVIEGAWTEAMRQLGNAVPVKLAMIIANSVFTALKNR